MSVAFENISELFMKAITGELSFYGNDTSSRILINSIAEYCSVENRTVIESLAPNYDEYEFLYDNNCKYGHDFEWFDLVSEMSKKDIKLEELTKRFLNHSNLLSSQSEEYLLKTTPRWIDEWSTNCKSFVINSLQEM